MKNIKKLEFIFNDKYRILFYGITLGTLGFVGQYFNRRVSMDGNLYGSIFLFYFNALCTIGALILFVKLFLKKSVIFKDIGKKTMFFLGYQNIIIVILKYFFPILGSNYLYMFINSIITFLILYILSFIVYKFLPFMVGKFKFSVKNWLISQFMLKLLLL